jgi:hypothetical protein
VNDFRLDSYQYAWEKFTGFIAAHVEQFTRASQALNRNRFGGLVGFHNLAAAQSYLHYFSLRAVE